jgi:hypothetical protein
MFELTGARMMSEQAPTIGITVFYTLSEQDAQQINHTRQSSEKPAHVGNPVSALDVFPMMIVKTYGSTADGAVNGQVFIDGNSLFWAESVSCGTEPGTWAWSIKAEAAPAPAGKPKPK